MYTCLLFQNNLGVNAKVKKPKRTPIEWLKKYFLEGKEVCTSFMNITTRQAKSKELVMKADLPTLLNRRLQDLCIFMYKVKHKLCPAYISNIFKEPNSNYNLRQADFSTPRYETVTYGKHSIRYLGPRLWTKLPKSIRDVTTLMSFKGKILNSI